jgi:endoribonuclease Dicer
MFTCLLQIIKEYFPPPDNYLYLNPSLRETLSLFQSDIVDIAWDNLHMKYHVTRNSLGPYSADLFIYHEVRTRVNQLLLELDTHDDRIANFFDVQEDGMDIDDLPSCRNNPACH